MTSLLVAQNGWGLTQGSSYGEAGNSIHLSYRMPGASFRDPATGRNLAPQSVPVILGYTRTVEDAHMLTLEGGWVQAPFLLITDQNGDPIEVPANIPQLRFSYRWMPLGGDHLLEPYAGIGAVAGVNITRLPNQPFWGFNGDVQAMIGFRFFAAGPLFFQAELPYTLLTMRRLLFPDGSTGNSFQLGPEFTTGQFWPLFGIGVKW